MSMQRSSQQWNLRYAPAATAGIRKIPRGPAAIVTESIRTLQRTPLPYVARPVPTGREDTYELLAEGYVVTYELVEQERLVRILAIEPAPSP